MGLSVGQRINIYEVLKIDPQWKGCLHMQLKNPGRWIPALRFVTTKDLGTYCSYNLEFEYRHCGRVAIKRVGTMIIKKLK